MSFAKTCSWFEWKQSVSDGKNCPAVRARKPWNLRKCVIMCDSYTECSKANTNWNNLVNSWKHLYWTWWSDLRGGWTKAWLASLFARVCQRASGGGGGGGGGHKSSGVNPCERNVKAALTNVRFNWTWKVRNWNPWPCTAKNWFSIHFPPPLPPPSAVIDISLLRAPPLTLEISLLPSKTPPLHYC